MNVLFNTLGLRRSAETKRDTLHFLVPARNEEKNIQRLLGSLAPFANHVTVYDDESDDNTATVAQSLGTTVIPSFGPPPHGWRGKTWACSQLRKATLNEPVEWLVYLDADLEASPAFVDAMTMALGNAKPDTQLVTGFPRFAPGKGLEPIVSAWAILMMLSTCPFWLVRASGFRKPYFANGQIMAFRRAYLEQHDPFEQCRSEVLEDVQIARLMGNCGHKSEVFLFTDVLTVHMYETAQEAFQGFRKNSAFIGRTIPGTVCLAMIWIAISLVACITIGLYLTLTFSMALALILVKRNPLWAIASPLAMLIGAFTMLASAIGHQRGDLKWKGRPLS